MIARLRGQVVVADADHVVLETGGVGYQVHCHLRTLAALHEMGDREVILHIHTSVSDDAIRLYRRVGFATIRTVYKAIEAEYST